MTPVLSLSVVPIILTKFQINWKSSTKSWLLIHYYPQWKLVFTLTQSPFWTIFCTFWAVKITSRKEEKLLLLLLPGKIFSKIRKLKLGRLDMIPVSTLGWKLHQWMSVELVFMLVQLQLIIVCMQLAVLTQSVVSVQSSVTVWRRTGNLTPLGAHVPNWVLFPSGSQIENMSSFFKFKFWSLN